MCLPKSPRLSNNQWLNTQLLGPRLPDIQLQLPTPIEREFYYHGIPGKLLARTSSFRFPASIPQSDGHYFRFCNIGPYIGHYWTAHLVFDLQRVLKDVPWQRFYPIGIRIDGNVAGDYLTSIPHERKLMMVDVEPNNMAPMDLARKALQCKAVLARYGIGNLDVEIREVSQRLYAMDVDIEREVERRAWQGSGNAVFSYETLVRMLSHIGYPTAPEAGGRYGTMGLHLQLMVNGAPQVYGLTCRHVAHRPTSERVMVPTKRCWIRDRDGYMNLLTPSHRMVQATPQMLRGIREDLRSGIERAGVGRRNSRHQFRRGIRRVRSSTRARKRAERAGIIKKTYERLVNIGDKPEARTIGRIAVMPPLEASSRGFWRDWALIQLDEGKFARRPANDVFVSEQDMAALLADASHTPELGNLYQSLRASRNSRGLMPLVGCAAPTTRMNEPSFSVGKRGATTGFTYGVTNEVKAAVRLVGHDGKELTSVGWEWVVIPPRCGQPSVPQFCDEGDSGSVVFSSAGRVIGMVRSGNAPHTGSDVIETADLGFVTPIHFIMEDIRKATGLDVRMA